MTVEIQTSSGFRRWRATRPFWAGALAVTAGLEILLLPVSGFQFLLIQGLGGIGSIVIAAALITCGIALWRQPHRAVFLGWMIFAIGLTAYVVANLGGFLVGMALAIGAAALAVAWHPDSDE